MTERESMIKKIFIYSLAVFFIGVANAETIVTESTTNSKIITEGNMETTVKSPPPSAISPQLAVVVIVTYVQ